MLIYRVILLELSEIIFLSVIGLNLILMMEKLLRLSKMITAFGVSFLDILKIIFLIQPQIMLFTIPISMLLSVLIVYGRMSFDNEIVVLRSAGMSLSMLFKPVFHITIGLLILSFFISLYLMPATLKRLRNEINTLFTKHISMAIEPGVFFNTFKDLIIFIKKKEEKILKNIFIYENNKNINHKVITAKSGKIEIKSAVAVFTLYDGVIHIASDNATEIRFKKYVLKLNSPGEFINKKRGEMSAKELYKKANYNSIEGREFFIELYRRFSFPILIVPIYFISCSLSLVSGRSGRTWGIFIGLSILVTYYIALVYFENLFRSAKMGDWGCWIPFVVLVVFSIIIFIYKNKYSS